MMRGRVHVLVPTVLVTWLVSTFALAYMLRDPSDLTTFYFYFVVVTPSLGIPLAAVLATQLAKLHGRPDGSWDSSSPTCTSCPADCRAYFWAYAAALALPATYAGSAAACAASVQRT
jgi:hypothetical protein